MNDSQKEKIGRNEPCSCGSGRKYKKCCALRIGTEETTPFFQRYQGRLALAAMILLAAAAVAANYFRSSEKTVSKPEAWKYNAETDQHWHPDHQHWHAGKPPPLDDNGNPIQIPLSGSDQAASTQPTAWEYDAANDRHWHPEHEHWHEGRPPQTQTQTSQTGTGDPWEYDAANDRHWHPEHEHWHSGPPPDNPSTSSPISTTVKTGSDPAPSSGERDDQEN